MNPSALLVALSCLTASASYIGAIRQGALVTLLMPAVLLTGLVGARFRDRQLFGLLTVSATALAGGEVANILSGDLQGPVARGTFVAAGLTGLAVLVSSSRAAATFLAPVAGIIGWALALGAGARVELIAVATAVLGLLALAAVERERRAFTRPPRTAPSLLVALVLVAAVGVVAGRYQLAHNHRAPASPFQSTLTTTVSPPALLSLTRHPPRSATAPVPPQERAAAAAATPHGSLLQRVLVRLGVAFAALLALVLVLGLLRLFWVGLAWRLLRRRLRRAAGPSEAGAWAWALATRERLGHPVSRSLSPDMAARGGDEVPPPLRELAVTVTPVVFGSVAGSPELAWSQARAVHDDAWRTASSWHRFRARCLSPARQPKVAA